MRGSSWASRYAWGVGTIGLAFWVLTIQQEAPWVHADGHELTTTAILVVLSLLSAFSPIPTRGGGTLTVTLAPLFGAVAVPLSPWAVMTVAAIGTIDSRIPGKQIGWDRFIVNRGMYIFAAGIPSFVIHETGLTPWGYAIALALMLALNTILVGIFFALLEGKSLTATIRAAYSGNGLTYVALPITGILVGHLLRAPTLVDQLVVFLLYGPLLIYRASIQKQRRLIRGSVTLTSCKAAWWTSGTARRLVIPSESVSSAKAWPACSAFPTRNATRSGSGGFCTTWGRLRFPTPFSSSLES